MYTSDSGSVFLQKVQISSIRPPRRQREWGVQVVFNCLSVWELLIWHVLAVRVFAAGKGWSILYSVWLSTHTRLRPEWFRFG